MVDNTFLYSFYYSTSGFVGFGFGFFFCLFVFFFVKVLNCSIVLMHAKILHAFPKAVLCNLLGWGGCGVFVSSFIIGNG